MTQIIFIDAKYEGEIEFGKELIDYLIKNKIKSIALFYAVQFTNVGKVREQMEKLGIKVLATKAKRTSVEGQILGCDIYHDSFKDSIIDESDAVLYIGDGLFHPKALLLSQIKNKKIKPVLIWNPIANKFSILKDDSIKEQINKTKRNLRMFINARTIGILVTIKPGQNYFLTAQKLKAHLEKNGKRAYIFIDDTIDLRQLENYPFIEAWVNTACPRIGTDDIVNTRQAIINIKEAFNPVKALEEINYQSSSSTFNA